MLIFHGSGDDPGSYRNLGVSIDEPLAPDFPTSEPHKVWIYVVASPELAQKWYWIETILLPVGEHTFYVGVDSPPGKTWLVKLIVNDQVVIDETSIDGTTQAQGTVYLDADSPYATWKVLEFGESYCYYGYGEEFPPQPGWWCRQQGREEPVPFPIPAICDPYFCNDGYYQLINPNKGEWYWPFFRIHNNKDIPNKIPWNGSQLTGVRVSSITSIPIILASTHIADFPSTTVTLNSYLPYFAVFTCRWDHCPLCINKAGYPLSNNSSIKITDSDYIRIHLYHMEGEAPTLDEFWYGSGRLGKILAGNYTLVPDQTFDINFRVDESCNLPKGYAKAMLDVSEALVVFQAPTDIRVGRTFLIMYPKLWKSPDSPEDAISIPFVRFREAPAALDSLGMNLHVVGATLGPKYDQPIAVPIRMFITQEMIDAGGFTLEAGHFEVDPDNTSPSAPMIPVVDDYKFYDFQKGKWLGPATIDSVSLERLTPPAKINSVSLERVQIKKATIDSVLLERISAPPPPPERNETYPMEHTLCELHPNLLFINSF